MSDETSEEQGGKSSPKPQQREAVQMKIRSDEDIERWEPPEGVSVEKVKDGRLYELKFKTDRPIDISIETGDQYRDCYSATLTSEHAGSITVGGNGRCNVVRDGAGEGHAIRQGAGKGDTTRGGTGKGDAVRDGSGAGNALRKNDGEGHAVRNGRGDGSSTRDGAGTGNAVRRGEGDGDASVKSHAKGDAVRSGSGDGNARVEHQARGNAIVSDDAQGNAENWSDEPGDAVNQSKREGDAARGGDGAGSAVRDGEGDGRAVRDGKGDGHAWRDGNGAGEARNWTSGEGHAARTGSGGGGAERQYGNGDEIRRPNLHRVSLATSEDLVQVAMKHDVKGEDFEQLAKPSRTEAAGKADRSAGGARAEQSPSGKPNDKTKPATLQEVVGRSAPKPPAPTAPKSDLQEIVAKLKSREGHDRSARTSAGGGTAEKPGAIRTPGQAAAKGAAMTAGHVAGGVAARAAGATIAGAGNPIAGAAIAYAADSVIEKGVEKGLTGRETSLTETARAGAKKVSSLVADEKTGRASTDQGERAGTTPGTKPRGTGQSRSGGNELQRLVKHHQEKNAPPKPNNELQALLEKNRRRTAGQGQQTPTTARAAPRIGASPRGPAAAPVLARGSAERAAQSRANTQERR